MSQHNIEISIPSEMEVAPLDIDVAEKVFTKDEN